MKKVLKKISLKNASEILSDSQLKQVIGGYEGTGPGSPCYSSSGSCYGRCVFVDTYGHPHGGNCEDVGSNICACVEE